MGYEDKEPQETVPSGSPQQAASTMTLQQAIDMGEYDPQYLANYPEWHQLSKHAQLQYIRKAQDNRDQQLITQWAEINNVIDFRNKPELKKALMNIEVQMKKVDADRERLYLEYSS